MTKPNYLTAEDHVRVSAAVSKAEELSAGEILTVLADRSDGYTDVALAWAALATICALMALAFAPEFFLGHYERLTGGWIQEWTPHNLFMVAATVAALKFAGVTLIQLWQPLKFFLVPPPIKTTRVHDRAVRAFRIGAERRTHGRTGILVYVSMREHRAEIVADEAIATRVDPEVWGDAMEAMLAELKQGRTADAMIAAVERVGAVLAEHFPRAQADTDELPNRLIEV